MSSKSILAAMSPSIVSRARLLRRSWDIVVRKEFFKNDKDLNDLSPSATLTGRHKNILRATHTSGRMVFIPRLYILFNKSNGAMRDSPGFTKINLDLHKSENSLQKSSVKSSWYIFWIASADSLASKSTMEKSHRKLNFRDVFWILKPCFHLS